MLYYPLPKHTQLITLPLTSIWLPHLHSCPLGSHPQYRNNTCKLIPWTNLNLQKLILDITRTEVLYLQTACTLGNSMSQNEPLALIIEIQCEDHLRTDDTSLILSGRTKLVLEGYSVLF